MYPRAISQLETEENVGITMVGRWEGSGGEPWLTMASGNGSPPGGRTPPACTQGPARAAAPWSAAWCRSGSRVRRSPAQRSRPLPPAWPSPATGSQAVAGRAGRQDAEDDCSLDDGPAYKRVSACHEEGQAPARRRCLRSWWPGSLLTRSDLRPLQIGVVHCSKPKRLNHDAEDLGVVHLPADALAARPTCRQNYVFAGMHIGVDHRRQISEAEHRAGNILVAIVCHIGAGVLARDRGLVRVIELGAKGLVVVRQARREQSEAAAHVHASRIALGISGGVVREPGAVVHAHAFAHRAGGG